MIIISILLFAIAALLGATMLFYLLRGRRIPRALAILHGSFAVPALVLLIIYSLRAAEGAWIAIIIFIGAASGGLLLLYKDVTGKAPKWLGIVHGLVASAGFLTLLAFAYRHSI